VCVCVCVVQYMLIISVVILLEIVAGILGFVYRSELVSLLYIINKHVTSHDRGRHKPRAWC